MYCFSVQLHSARAMRGASGDAMLRGGAEPHQGNLYKDRILKNKQIIFYI